MSVEIFVATYAMISQLYAQLGDDIKALQDENAELKIQVRDLGLKIQELERNHRQQKLEMRKTFKIQHKQQVQKYKDKIEVLLKERRVLSPKDINIPVTSYYRGLKKRKSEEYKTRNSRDQIAELETNDRFQESIKPSNYLPFDKYDNPNLIATQYSDDSEPKSSQLRSLSPQKPSEKPPLKPSIQELNKLSSSPVKQNTCIVPYPNNDLDTQFDVSYHDIDNILANTTTLYKRQWLTKYYEYKFHKYPEFEIDLTTNPITRSPWTINDFTRKFEITETPPFFYIKNNTPQEDQFKHEKFQRDLKQLISLRLRQIFSGENEFFIEILNRYVKSGRYIRNTSIEK